MQSSSSSFNNQQDFASLFETYQQLPPLAQQLESLRRTQQTLISNRPAFNVTSRKRPVYLTERDRFLMFFKILLKYLSKSNVDARMAKLIVAKCIRENRSSGYTNSLVDSASYELRRAIGDIHWYRANKCFDSYCSKLGVKPVISIESIPTCTGPIASV